MIRSAESKPRDKVRAQAGIDRLLGLCAPARLQVETSGTLEVQRKLQAIDYAEMYRIQRNLAGVASIPLDEALQPPLNSAEVPGEEPPYFEDGDPAPAEPSQGPERKAESPTVSPWCGDEPPRCPDPPMTDKRALRKPGAK